MKKKELEFFERFLNIEKQVFTDTEKRISFYEMFGDMKLNNNDINKIIKSLTIYIDNLLVKE